MILHLTDKLLSFPYADPIDMRTLGQIFLLAAALALAACNQGDKARQATANGTGSDAALPKPETGGGSVTGMPDHPGPGNASQRNPDALPPDTAVASDGSVLPEPVDTNGDAMQPPDEGGGDNEQAPADEPTPDDAVNVVRDYYRAIDAHDYANAYVLWSDGGHSSGKSLQQFADGFADTAHVDVQLQPPGRVDAAAGSRYIEVPVSITAIQRDGSERHYSGIYTLRRAVVDGASAQQREWRIGSAQMHEIGG